VTHATLKRQQNWRKRPLFAKHPLRESMWMNRTIFMHVSASLRDGAAWPSPAGL
jgi:hypothetical protein